MNTTYRFAPLPNRNSMVAGLVTTLVSVWFLMAAAAIFAEPAATRVERSAVAQRAGQAAIAIAPQARLRITVEAPRLKS